MVKVAQLAELRVVVPAVAGSNPVLHPNHLGAPAGAERRPSRLTTDAGVAELVDALDLGSGELCSWRFKSSHPHHLLSNDPPTDHVAVRGAPKAAGGPFQRQTENHQ